ncbi:hypothetical protein L0P88_02305 [Muricauda sp. SCSIO 64092]|uniref:hypothetical protein n=1 Tax=Allomuricauda sp. SCSIO 64092 TaxID=2908842 RepID=UPI001FF1A3A7|nr:hypothetical protein [Muricauda sp. SCSIO 64092]UOY07397.1 hypothetical protein L0P88_02305 [Muricauda sp. SCSIO 64092]
MTNQTVKPPIWFWVVSIFAFLWNLVGVYSYLNSKLNQVAMLEAMTQEQRELFEGIPAWATAAFAIAVFSGAIASIGLLIRKKWAKPLFILSLLAAVLQFINWLFLQNAGEVYGGQAYVMPVLVVIIGIFLILFSKRSIAKGWLK